MPFRYEDRRFVTPLAEISGEGPSVAGGIVGSLRIRPTRRRNVFAAAFDLDDGTASVGVVVFGARNALLGLSEGRKVLLYGRPVKRDGEYVFPSPEYTLCSENGTPPPGWDRIVPIYPTTAGLARKTLASLIRSCVTSDSLVLCDPLPEALLKKYSFPSLDEALRGIHIPSCQEEIERSEKRLAYQEFFELQKALWALRKRVFALESPNLARGGAMRRRFMEALPFEPTDAQRRAVAEIAEDLSRSRPMRRLLQGDVGCGKTIVALGALAQAVGAGFRAAVLVPTTVLSGQFRRACERHLSPVGVRCAEVLGGMSEKARASLRRALEDGEVDVVVGTHALLEEWLSFDRLGLVVIDEQHRFGVAQRERMADKGRTPHLLAMSATPIPRTLCMALYGEIDSTVIAELPSSRKPVTTKIVSDNHIDELYAFLEERVASGGRCYWVCPYIGDEKRGEEGASGDESVLSRASHMRKTLRGVRVETLHGRLSAEEKRASVARFASGECDVLVSTTVIEVGIDVPEANLIVVESASGFGLSQLHQLRGRVGRGEAPGICILLDRAANIRGNRRLAVLKECSDGFAIAEKDLEMRGPGEIAGFRQHGELSFRVADVRRDADVMRLAVRDAAEMFGDGARAGGGACEG